MRATLLKKKASVLQRRRRVIRKRVNGAEARPRVAFHKSLKHLYAQAVDDTSGKTLAAATTATKANAGSKKNFANIASAKTLGAAFGQQLKEKGIEAIVFDRGGHQYHGVVKAFADAVREQGIRF